MIVLADITTTALYSDIITHYTKLITADSSRDNMSSVIIMERTLHSALTLLVGCIATFLRSSVNVWAMNTFRPLEDHYFSCQ